MSILTRRMLILVLLVVYMILLFVFFYPTFAANCCGGTAATDDTGQVDEPVNNYLLASKWDTTGIFTSSAFPAFRDSLLQLREKGKVLEIIGFYYEGEAVPANQESPGLARAQQIRDAHFSSLPAEQIKLSARPFPANPDVRSGFFPAGILNWEASENTVKEDVEVLDDRIVIRFPYKSVEKVYNQAVDDYLEKLAPQLIESGDQVRLSGHTDNIGGDAYNQDLGQKRAEAIKALLLDYGVPAGQITTESKGKSLPVDTNETEEGRQNNRRVELVRINTSNSSPQN